MSMTTIKILYWAEQEGNDLHGPIAIDEFKKSLSVNYNTVVHGRPGELGGGINELIIEIITSMSLKDVANSILLSATYDIVKQGSKSFIIKPFMDAYKALRDVNDEAEVDIYSMQFTFEDSVVKIYKISKDSIYASIGMVLNNLSKNYDKLVLINGEKPFEIYVPVFKDPSPEYSDIYRLKYNVDETIENFSIDDYAKFWGLYYDYSRTFKTYDLQNQILIDKGQFFEDRF
jgi:hypothetical protein